MVAIDGVRVLNTIPAEEALPIGACVLVCVVMFALITIMAIVSSGDDIEARALCGLLATGVVVGVLCGVWVWLGESKKAFPETYQITVSDDVSFNDFNAAYEVVSQDGKILRVKTRET